MAEFEELFLHPPKSARPMVRWWWPCVDVEEEELRKEIAELDDRGFLGAEIQAFATGMPRDMLKKDKKRYERCHRFMQPYYYEMVSAVLDEAQKRGMTIDLTACSGWPTGGAHVQKENSLQMLIFNQKTLKGSKHYRGPVPAAKKPPFFRIGKIVKLIFKLDLIEYYPDDLELKYVVAARPAAKPGKIKYFNPVTTLLDPESVIDLTAKTNKEGILDWEVPEGTWQIFAFYGGSSGSKPLLPAKESPEKESLILDHLSSEPINKHLQLHLGRGQEYFGNHFGRTLRSFFTDSLELLTEMMWTHDFVQEFKERRGYDPTPFLPSLFVPFKYNKYINVLTGNEKPCFDFEKEKMGERLRYDYELTVSDLFNEKFVKSLAEWGDARGLKSRIQAYGIRADLLKAFGLSHIPETEQLYAGGIMDFLKLAGSAGIIYGKPLVTAETMVWNRRDYMTTPAKWKVAVDRLFASGINQLIYHGFPYRDRHAECPEVYPFSSPHVPEQLCFSSNFSRVNPFWDFFPTLNNYVARCQYIMQQGKTECNVGVYYQAFNYCDTVVKQEELTGGYLDENDAPMAKPTIGGTLKKELNDEEKWSRAQVDLGDNLTANGYYYTHINEERILSGKVEGSKLITGLAALEVIIFNNIEYITPVLAEKLKEIVEGGVRVMFMGRLPERQPGYYDYKRNDAEIRELLAQIREKEEVLLPEGENAASFLKAVGIMPNLGFTQEQPHIYYIHKKTDEADYYFIRSNKNQPSRVEVNFPHGLKTPYILDPWSGESTEAALYETDTDLTRMELDFDPYGSYLLEFKHAYTGNEHVTSSPLKVTRANNQLVACADASGEFNFKLKNGKQCQVNISDPLPPQVELHEWQLEAEIRKLNGKVSHVRRKMRNLKDWRLIPALRYCSGRGKYMTEFSLDETYLSDNIKIVLSLGQVGDVAMVKCNGTELKPLLMPPYEIDITSHVNSGDNTLEILVVPTLNNRLIGYGRQGSSAYKNHKRKKCLMPSGLIGPVKLLPRREIVIKQEI